MSKKLISIGMPTYNNEATVERAIRSVMDQTHQNWCLYISDDFSSDQTLERIEKLAATTPDRIKIVSPSSRQYYMNFKHVLDFADTHYFAWLAGDDWWEPDFLARCLACLENEPQAVACLARCMFYNSDGSSYIDPKARAMEEKMSLRVARYLLDPDQTRMYGLFRREALVRSFPSEVCHAYDWCLIAGTLRLGTHVDIDEHLLNRERTPSAHYIDVVDQDEPSSVLRFFPVLSMSWIGLRNGIIPITPRVMAALFYINLLKNRQQMQRRAKTLAKLISPIYRVTLLITKRLAAPPLSLTQDKPNAR